MNKIKKFILYFPDISLTTSMGLLILRIGSCLSLMTHGYGKLISFSEKSSSFMNHLALGSELSLSLIIFAEFFCSIFVLLGLGTRVFCIPIIYAFIVIVFDVHLYDPFSRMEKGILFLTIFSSLLLLGPGKYSADYFISKKIKN